MNAWGTEWSSGDEGRWVPEWELAGYYDQLETDAGMTVGAWRASRAGWAAEHHPGVAGGVWETGDGADLEWRPLGGGDWS